MKRKKVGRKEKKKGKKVKEKERYMQWIFSKVWEKKEENQKIRFKKTWNEATTQRKR